MNSFRSILSLLIAIKISQTCALSTFVPKPVSAPTMVISSASGRKQPHADEVNWTRREKISNDGNLDRRDVIWKVGAVAFSGLFAPSSAFALDMDAFVASELAADKSPSKMSKDEVRLNRRIFSACAINACEFTCRFVLSLVLIPA